MSKECTNIENGLSLLSRHKFLPDFHLLNSLGMPVDLLPVLVRIGLFCIDGFPGGSRQICLANDHRLLYIRWCQVPPTERSW